MVNFSLHVSSHFIFLLIILIVVARNEAGKITNSSAVTEIKQRNEDFNVEVQQDEPEVVETALDVNNQDTKARDTKYSYFYIGRWTWHIPLWFLLWFTAYIFGNVVRSIYGHAVSKT